MKSFVKPFAAGAAAALAAGGLFVQAPARAQQAPASTAPAAAATLADALARISQASGVHVVADSTVARQRVTPPIGAVTAATLEVHLAEIVRSLPGTQWAKVYLPATATSSSWTGDAVADYVYAQAKLFGNVGGATTAGTVEVLGQQVPADKAQSVVAALNLKPVYLLTNSSRRTAAPASGTAGSPGDWGRMTQQQQQQYAQQQAQQMLSGDPAQLAQTFQQQQAVRQALMQQLQQMPDAQRQQYLQSLGGAGGRGGFGGRGGAGGQGGQGGAAGNQGGRQGGRRGGGNQGGGGGNF